MTLQPEIILSGDNSLDTAAAIRTAQDQQNKNAMSTEQILQQHFQTLDMREKSRLTSTIAGAVQLKSFLDKNDTQGAQDFLVKRKNALQSRIGMGEAIDTEDTDYALEALKSGNVEQLKTEIGGLMAAGQVYGILQAPANNSYLQQFQAVQQAHPEWTEAQVQDYVYTRGNAANVTKFDDSGNIVTNPGAVDVTSNKKQREGYAENTGKAAGNTVIENDKALGTLNTLKSSVQAAKTQLERVSATGPIFGRTGAAANDVEYVNLQRDLNEITLLAKDLYNLGSGQGFTDADRNFLKQLSGGEYNREDSIKYALNRFDEALKQREQFLSSQSQRYQQQYGAGQQPTAPQGQQSTIRVVNPKTNEAFDIDQSDLAAAQAEGFVVSK